MQECNSEEKLGFLLYFCILSLCSRYLIKKIAFSMVSFMKNDVYEAWKGHCMQICHFKASLSLYTVPLFRCRSICVTKESPEVMKTDGSGCCLVK